MRMYFMILAFKMTSMSGEAFSFVAHIICFHSIPWGYIGSKMTFHCTAYMYAFMTRAYEWDIYIEYIINLSLNVVPSLSKIILVGFMGPTVNVIIY